MIWTLLIIFQFKHFIADYLLQNKYMLGKFLKEGWFVPLASHCGVHWLFTFTIAFITSMYGDKRVFYSIMISAAIATMDFVIHMVMDRLKASPDLLGRYKALSANEYIALQSEQKELIKLDEPKLSLDTVRFKIRANRLVKHNTYFWWSLGFDQMVHKLTDLMSVYFIMQFL